MEQTILLMQQQMDVLKAMDVHSSDSILLTRQEAADLLGKSLRQLDRDCHRYGIVKEFANGGIRIRKSHLLMHMGLLPKPTTEEYKTEFERIRGRLNR